MILKPAGHAAAGSEFIIGDWLSGTGPNRSTISALLFGAHTSDGQLQACGTVSTGLTAAQRRHLLKALDPLRGKPSPVTSIIADAHPIRAGSNQRWSAMSSAANAWRTSRHPSWKRLPGDIDSSSVKLD